MIDYWAYMTQFHKWLSVNLLALNTQPSTQHQVSIGHLNMTKLFVKIPVRDLDRSISFYSALGFIKNPQFSDETAACMVISEHNYVMLLTHDKFKSFSKAPIPDENNRAGFMIALECDDINEVDTKIAAGIKAGGSEPTPTVDYGFMYQRTITDPDGHRWEPFYMDLSRLSQNQS
jgi:predicted lactoylglutathione lyase